MADLVPSVAHCVRGPTMRWCNEDYHRSRRRLKLRHHSQSFPSTMPAVNTLADVIRAADGVIIVSPEYN
jgi:NAD(P)H-dependent FMN reductase